MNLRSYYWYFKKAIPEHLCDTIVRYGLSIQQQMAVTGGYNNDPKKLNAHQVKDLKKKRNSDIVWIAENWLYKEIHPFLSVANRSAGWNFQWDHSESCQFTQYKKGQYYDWHCDSWDGAYNNPKDPNSHGKIRKLSSTLLVSDSKNFKGGELEFDFRNKDPNKKSQPQICTEVCEKGDIVFFPSFVWHRVRPVKSGTRHSIVNWHLGWPFK